VDKADNITVEAYNQNVARVIHLTTLWWVTFREQKRVNVRERKRLLFK
jgi:hypothetical protein